MAIKLIIGVLFCISFIMHIIFLENENNRGCYYTKPLLMPLLAIYYVSSIVQINKLIILALVFAFIGDVFLMWPGRKNNFIFGLGAFLIGHLCYVLLFLQDVSFLKDLVWWFYLIIIIYAMVAFAIIKKLKNHLGDMKIPTYIYMAVILFMSFVSLSRMWVMGMSLGAFLPFIGSLLFLCSDSMLGFYTFKGKFKNGAIYIMITYVLAQALIVGGYLY